jgi:hypothetical protein
MPAHIQFADAVKGAKQVGRLETRKDPRTYRGVRVCGCAGVRPQDAPATPMKLAASGVAEYLMQPARQLGIN